MKNLKNIAIIGLGHMGRIHLKEFNKVNNASISCISDIDPNNAAIANSAGISFETDPYEILRNKKIDGIIIATPTSAHEELCSFALAKGIDVLVEKPCGNSLDGLMRLKELEKIHGKRVYIGSQCRFMAPAKKMSELIDEYSIIPESINVEWTKLHRRSHGGAHYDEAYHSLDLVNHFLHSYLKSVYASLTTKVVDLQNIGKEELVASANFWIKYITPGINNVVDVNVYAGMHEAQEIRRIAIKGIVPKDRSYIKITGWFSDVDKVFNENDELDSDILTGLTTQSVHLLKADKANDGFSTSQFFIYPGRNSGYEKIMKLKNDLWVNLVEECAAQGVHTELIIENEKTNDLADQQQEWVNALHGEKTIRLATLDDAIEVHKVISMGIASERAGQVIYTEAMKK
ncbi:MAG: Gfo/Idh/MocA family oxidoreductase [Nanoarchaeota archaeon]|nr:Gfo/Idh/MocA family oxidoreductase [Nanoarchaeota archaeon]